MKTLEKYLDFVEYWTNNHWESIGSQNFLSQLSEYLACSLATACAVYTAINNNKYIALGEVEEVFECSEGSNLFDNIDERNAQDLLDSVFGNDFYGVNKDFYLQISG